MTGWGDDTKAYEMETYEPEEKVRTKKKIKKTQSSVKVAHKSHELEDGRFDSTLCDSRKGFPHWQDKIDAQVKFCEKLGLPYFLPLDGVCEHCQKQIYNEVSLHEASTMHLTSCWMCGRSYCE